MAKKIEKTNAARLLDRAKIAYDLVPYTVDEDNLAATHVAEELGENIATVFKTLVLRGDRIGHFVCVIPGDKEVDLNRSRIAEPVTCDHGVVDVLFEIIDKHVGHTGDTALRTAGVGFFEGRLAAECNTILLGASYFEGKTHARYTATDDEKIILFHMLLF